MGRGWKTRIDGTPQQIGQKYPERERVYPYGARRRGSGTVLAPQPRSVEFFKKPGLTKNERALLNRIEKIQVKQGVARTKDLRLKEDLHGKLIGGADLKTLKSLIIKGEVYAPRPGYYKSTREPPKKPKREPFPIDDLEKAYLDGKITQAQYEKRRKQRDAGFVKGQQEAALGRYKPHKSESDDWKKGYDRGWRDGAKKPQWDEIVLINNEEDFTAWEKRRAIMQSEVFQIWLNERYNTKPMPSDPYRAFMIDKSLEAKLKTKPEWAERTNRADYQPIDYPPVTKQPPPDITQPAPKTIEAQKTKGKLRDRMKYLAKEMGTSEVALRFTVVHKGYARSFYKSGYGINRITGELVKISEPEIVLGIPKNGKLNPQQYAVLSHEMGHHKQVEQLKKEKGEGAVVYHYRALERSKAAKIECEREAWKNAEPYLKDFRPSQKWLKKWALGTYIGTSPGYRKKPVPAYAEGRELKAD